MKLISIDTETHTFSPGNMAPRVVCCSWAVNQEVGIVAGDHLETYLLCMLRNAIEGSYKIIGHGIAYDMACILATFPDLWDLVWRAYSADCIVDTQIREQLLDIATDEFKSKNKHGVKNKKKRYGLDVLARKYLGNVLDKGEDGWRVRYGELDGIPVKDWPKRAVDYAEEDARSPLAIYHLQETRARRIQYDLPTQYDDTRADFALRLMSIWGIRTDPERVRPITIDTIHRLNSLSDLLTVSGITRQTKPSGDLLGPRDDLPVVIKTTKTLRKIRELVIRHYPGNPPKTRKGAISTERDVLEECRCPELETLVEYSKLEKAYSTYLTKLKEPIVQARFKALGAASSRTSSSRPNLQNQPRIPGIRECFVARPGRVFVACDFDSQEMRTLAQSCLDLVGVSRLAEKYQANPAFDPHLEFAASLLEISVDEAVRRREAGDPEIGIVRQQAKVSNFGFPGGMCAETMMGYSRGYGIEIDLRRSQELREAWFRQWYEMDDYFRVIQDIVGQASYGTVIIPRSGFRRQGCGYTDAANCYFQALAAHASKRAAWAVSKSCYSDRSSALYGSRPVVFVHDELIVETLEEVAHEVALALEATMVEAMEYWTPDVPARASSTVMRRWSKKAKRILDERGRIIPWEEIKVV